MLDWLIDFVYKICGDNVRMCVYILSLLPVIEVRGAIPLGISLGLNGFESYAFAILGSLTSIILLTFLLPLIFNIFNKKKFYNKFKNMMNSKIKILTDKKINIYLALTLFVSIPVPLTGVFTGCVFSVLLGLDKFKSALCIFFGNLIAGGIILFASILLGSYSIYLTIFFMVMLGVMAVYYLTKLAR